MYNINEETKQLAMRLLFHNNDNREVNMTLQTKTTLETSTKICIFKNQLVGYKSLNDLYEFSENNNFSIFYVPNSCDFKNFLFIDIDSQSKDKLGNRLNLTKDEMKIITQVLFNLNLLKYCTFVSSGTGLHLYIELDFSATAEQFDNFQNIIYNKMNECGIIIDKMNQNHRMRFCGSINEKYNRKSEVISAFESEFNSFLDKYKDVKTIEKLEKSDIKEFEKQTNDLRKEIKQNINKSGIDTRFAYYNVKTQKISTRWTCLQILNYFYEKNNYNRRNTFFHTLNFLYAIGIFQDKRDLFRKYNQYKRCCIDKLQFAEKSKDFIENDEFFDILKKSKFVKQIKQGDFNDVKFENSEYEQFFTK